MFQQFAQAVHAQFNEMSKQELFVVDIDGDALYAAYLAAFPGGTNPIFRVNTEHDCSCCKNFIRNIGNVVAINQHGNLVTVWDMSTGDPLYDQVTLTLAAAVRAAPIRSIFRSEMPSYGAEKTAEPASEKNGGRQLMWHHFHAKVARAHFAGDKAATKIGEASSLAGVFKRGLRELRPDDVQTLLDLVNANALYKGAEKLHLLTGFQGLQQQYQSLPAESRDLFVWSFFNQPAARIRNDVIGTLLQDLAEGKPLEVAVKSYEDKVSGTNYKRPTALITPRMAEDAAKTIAELGIEPSLHRRMARIDDVSVNDILFVDNAVRGRMKGGIGDLLMDAAISATAGREPTNAVDITAADFIKQILPKAKTLGVFVKNAHQGNFMTVTAPQYADAEPLFKWDNGFAWSYAGNVADSSLRKQVAALGGRVDGVLRFSHTWNYDARNASLMDLHVFMPGASRHEDGQHDSYPSGQRVGWNQRNDSRSGGVQDVDYVEAAPEGYVPVENITFPSMERLQDGEYTFKIHNWNLRQPTKGGFRAEIEFAGQLYQYDHAAPLKHKEWITLAVATLKDGQFTIRHEHPTTTTSQEKWGVTTEVFTKVDTVMKSPNCWSGQNAGAEHLFFILEGCKNPAPTRGIYNEFLRSDLDKHRKAFEILGNKTMCEPTADQISGVGFTAARGDAVKVRIDGRAVYNVQF